MEAPELMEAPTPRIEMVAFTHMSLLPSSGATTHPTEFCAMSLV